MKKLFLTLLIGAFALSVFVPETQAAGTSRTAAKHHQTQAKKKKKSKRTKKRAQRSRHSARSHKPVKPANWSPTLVPSTGGGLAI